MKILETVKKRWEAESPRFFKWVMGVALSLSSVALSIQGALTAGGAETPLWWQTVYPYLIGFGAGMAAVAKLN